MNTDRLKGLWEQSTDKYGDARKMGSTYQTMYNIIYKGSVPKVDLLERIAKFYQKPIGFFFDEATPASEEVAELEAELHDLRVKVETYENALRLLGNNVMGIEETKRKKRSV